MRKEHIRRVPVIHNKKLAGIISETDLLNASPSDATSLSIWEINYLLSKLTVEEVMTKEVFTITEDTPIEEAARIMADHKFGGLPVMRNGDVVGMITETDLFRVFLELFGARQQGVRVTVLIDDIPGSFARVAALIGEAGGNIIAVGQVSGENQSNREVVFKISGMDPDLVKRTITPAVQQIKDLRECCS
jgi:acetoin utilization protein AcuB